MRSTRKAIECSYWPDGQPLVRRHLVPKPEQMDRPPLKRRSPLPMPRSDFIDLETEEEVL